MRNSKKTVILSSGSHAKSLLFLLKEIGENVVGCIDPIRPSSDVWLEHKVKWLGDDQFLKELDPSEYQLVNGMGSIGSTNLRKKLFDEAKKMGFFFPPLIHPSVLLSGDVLPSEGVQIMAGAILQSGVSIKDNSIVNTGCIIDHDTDIGRHVHLAPGVCVAGDVRIECGVHVGIGATIIQGIKVGKQAVIGAGAVVINNVEPRETVSGVPAKPH